jgi:thiosulfate/3-mercaptopyruvate sulfurtransferase
MRFGPLVDTAWLLERLGNPALRIVDCRWRLGQPGAGAAAYADAHIPGAAFLDVDGDLSSAPGPAGRHPLPDAQAFQAAARRAGIGLGTPVVAYDEAGEGGAVRLWWLLRHFGHEDAAVLDGGLAAWREAEGPLRTGAEQTEPGDFEARARDRDTLDAGELAERLADGRLALIDARAPERYSGESEPVDKVAGHIPGAGNAPFAELAPSGRFLPPADLRERLERAGAGARRELVAYCGSGVTACTVVLAAELAGLEARLYPGSWSEWSGLGLPAKTGHG